MTTRNGKAAPTAGPALGKLAKWGAGLGIVGGATLAGYFFGERAGSERAGEELAKSGLVPEVYRNGAGHSAIVGAPPESERPRPDFSEPVLGEQIIFRGACDASGAIPIDRNFFALADDEDNAIRIYDVRTGGPPRRELDATPTIPDSPEADFEASTRLGDIAFWLGSHGRGKKGTVRPERLVLLGTSLPSLSGELKVIGEPYQGLVAALAEDAAYASVDALRAGDSPPALNFEGMTATARESLLLGFRSPVPRGKALIAELLNPSDVLWGGVPVFAPPAFLDFGGLGVRALSSWRGDYLIVAGPLDDGPSKLYRWRGGKVPPSSVEIDFTDFNPEAFFTPEDRDEILLISDDGTQLVGGKRCKKLKDPSEKYFRGMWVRL